MSRHALKGAKHRRLYALVLTAEHGWVRFFHFGHNDDLMVDLDGKVVDRLRPDGGRPPGWIYVMPQHSWV